MKAVFAVRQSPVTAAVPCGLLLGVPSDPACAAGTRAVVQKSSAGMNVCKLRMMFLPPNVAEQSRFATGDSAEGGAITATMRLSSDSRCSWIPPTSPEAYRHQSTHLH